MGRIYVSGPMSGIAEFNYPAFNAKSAELRKAGHNVFNPAEIDLPPGSAWTDHMRECLPWVCKCDAMHMLLGWEASKGAVLERHNALALGMTITYEVAR